MGGASASTGTGVTGFASLVDEAAGNTAAVVEAKFLVEEASSSGERLPWDVEAVRRAMPLVERPPPGTSPDNVRWREYVAYYQKRHTEMTAARTAAERNAIKPPHRWSSYNELRDTFARGVHYQQVRVAALRVAAKLMGFSKPHIQANAGVLKGDLRYADALVIETDPTKPFRVETFSFKSRNFKGMQPAEMRDQVAADAQAAQRYYGGEVDIRTPALGMRGKPVKVDQVHLVYDGDGNLIDLKVRQVLEKLFQDITKETGVEVRIE